MTRRIILLIAASLLVLAAACGGGGVEENGGGDDNGGDVKGGDVTTTTAADDDDNPPVTQADDNGDDNGGDENADVPAGQDPEQILGENDDFDALAEACFDGNLFACDTLFIVTPVDSDQEAYAETCGGRVDNGDVVGGGCAEEFNLDAPDGVEPGTLGDEVDLDRLADGCFGGDFGDCDQLFADSDVDSDYEAYAEACGGRLPNNDLGFDFDCAAVFEPV